jgi:hypothetical protein
MDKLLLLLGFQLSQTAFIGLIDGSMWRLIKAGMPTDVVLRFDADTLLMGLQLLLSGTWIGRLSDLGDITVALVQGLETLPLALIALQWLAVLLWFMAGRLVLQRRLRRIEARAMHESVR